jgi:enoyl-CoA hydratase
MRVLVEKDGPITTVIISRPEVRNAVDPETAAALREAFRAFEKDGDALAAVLGGAGGCFCAGYDLKAASNLRVGDPSELEGDGPMGPSRTLLSKPVIAAVDGYAVAGGLELALWCDLRVMEEDAQFGVFCRRWGVPLIDGGTVRLPRLIGMSRALDMILTGRPVGAAEALQWGLANRVVPKGRARAEAQKLAREIARFPQTCIRADRAAALRSEGRGGYRPLVEEARAGATRFAAGAGRHGSFERL